MTDIMTPGSGIIFMKVGTHANEELTQIIARKRAEIEQAGRAMWGYGGNTCHPTSMVQPFAKAFAAQGRRIHLVMQRINSRHGAAQVRAQSFSEDGLNWQPIPEGVNVLGSKFALVIRGLREQDDMLDLSSTRVAVGRNQGRLGNRYVQGQADKACLEVTASERINDPSPRAIKISLVAELIAPYAVFLRET